MLLYLERSISDPGKVFSTACTLELTPSLLYIRFKYTGGDFIFENLDLTVPIGKITVFIGSNGCGKSTLLRSMARLLKPQRGSVVLNGADIASMSTKDVARKLAILPQGPTAPEGLTVMQLVKQGRYPYQSWLRQWSREDEEAVMAALKSTRLTDLADRTVDSLSGSAVRSAALEAAAP